MKPGGASTSSPHPSAGTRTTAPPGPRRLRPGGEGGRREPKTIHREERELILGGTRAAGAPGNANLEPQVKTDLLGIGYILGLRAATEGIVNAVFAQDELAEIKSQGLIGQWIRDAVEQERAAAERRAEEARITAEASLREERRRVDEERRTAEQRLEEATRAYVIRVLQGRFGTVPPRVVRRIHQANAATCDGWLDLAARAASLAEFTRDM